MNPRPIPDRKIGKARDPAAPWGPPPPFRALSAEARAALARLYERMNAALAPVAAACRACGECCRFKSGGIVLFASAIELAYLAAENEQGLAASLGDRVRVAGDRLWRCPFQQGDLCGACGARTLGCRTYFCDPAARSEGERLYAETFAQIKRIATEEGGPWWYGPAAAYLASAGFYC